MTQTYSTALLQLHIIIILCSNSIRCIIMRNNLEMIEMKLQQIKTENDLERIKTNCYLNDQPFNQFDCNTGIQFLWESFFRTRSTTISHTINSQLWWCIQLFFSHIRYEEREWEKNRIPSKNKFICLVTVNILFHLF